jgi:hypothetical protein
MQNIFIDWGVTKLHTVLIGQQTDSKKLSTIDFDSLKPFNAFLEAGCPSNLLYCLIDDGCEVYLCDQNLIHSLRGSHEKSDETDVHYIRELYLRDQTLFRKIALPQRKDIQIRYIMGQYLHYMKEHASFRRRQQAYEKEFGKSETYSEILVTLKKNKVEALKKLEPLLSEELSKIGDIKGIGLRYLAGLLATAHPKKFPTRSKYLSYCGYKNSSWNRGSGKYNRVAKCLAWQMSKSIILHKDPKFYTLYLKFKDDLRVKYPDYSKAKINGMAINRTSTFILKELYLRYSKT